MIYSETQGDLFSEDILTQKYALCHCISSDFAMGAGIAVRFAKLGVKAQLRKNYPNEWNGIGYCIITETDGIVVGNLITKQRYYHKPTLETLRQALENFCEKAAEMGIKKIAMPKIGCGLDKLQWCDVRGIIQDVFQNTDFEIVVRFI